VKCFSLVTEILGGPQAETVNARKEEQGVNIAYLKFAAQLCLRRCTTSIVWYSAPGRRLADFRRISNQQLPYCRHMTERSYGRLSALFF